MSKTDFCNFGKNCKNQNCKLNHICKFQNICKFGSKCKFIHENLKPTIQDIIEIKSIEDYDIKHILKICIDFVNERFDEKDVLDINFKLSDDINDFNKSFDTFIKIFFKYICFKNNNEKYNERLQVFNFLLGDKNKYENKSYNKLFSNNNFKKLANLLKYTQKCHNQNCVHCANDKCYRSNSDLVCTNCIISLYKSDTLCEECNKTKKLIENGCSFNIKKKDVYTRDEKKSINDYYKSIEILGKFFDIKDKIKEQVNLQILPVSPNSVILSNKNLQSKKFFPPSPNRHFNFNEKYEIFIDKDNNIYKIINGKGILQNNEDEKKIFDESSHKILIKIYNITFDENNKMRYVIDEEMNIANQDKVNINFFICNNDNNIVKVDKKEKIKKNIKKKLIKNDDEDIDEILKNWNKQQINKSSKKKINFKKNENGITILDKNINNTHDSNDSDDESDNQNKTKSKWFRTVEDSKIDNDSKIVSEKVNNINEEKSLKKDKKIKKSNQEVYQQAKNKKDILIEEEKIKKELELAKKAKKLEKKRLYQEERAKRQEEAKLKKNENVSDKISVLGYENMIFTKIPTSIQSSLLEKYNQNSFLNIQEIIDFNKDKINAIDKNNLLSIKLQIKNYFLNKHKKLNDLPLALIKNKLNDANNIDDMNEKMFYIELINNLIIKLENKLSHANNLVYSEFVDEEKYI
jgi:hypothetical protein